MEIQKVSPKGLDFIANNEGWFYLKPYRDQVGVPTISTGVTWYPNGTKVKMTDPPISLMVAKQLFLNILHIFEMGVYSRTRDDINQNQFDALVDFAYNVGLGNSGFAGSTLLKKVNINPNDLAIKDEFKKWVYAGGKESVGLKLRRIKDAALYFS